jgi:excisionase family DNA binding protein
MDTSALKLLTVEDVAARLRIGRTKAYELCNRQGFPALRVDGQIRVPEDSLRDWVLSRLRSSSVALPPLLADAADR